MIRGVKIGITEWGLPVKVQGPTICRFAKEVGIDGIELTLGEEADECFALANEYVLDAYREARAETGVEFPSLGINASNYYPMTAPRHDEGRKVIEYALRLGVDCAHALGIPLIHTPSFNASDVKSEIDLKNTVDCLQGLCDYAADKGVVVCTENSLDSETQLRELEMVNRDNFKVYFDTQNYYLQHGYDQAALVPPIAEYIAETHVKDGSGQVSNRLLGQGDAKVFETLCALYENGYNGWLVLENYYNKRPPCEFGGDFIELLREDLRTLDSWLEKIGDPRQKEKK